MRNITNTKKINEIFALSNKDVYKLSPYACKDTDAFRIIPDDKAHFRTPFAIDRDRILYSGAYRRYQGKTQVFSFSNLIDEEMTNRSLHTTYVSQISRTISKMLGLNLELVEAIALGHDLGHTPFGHDGERALSKQCIKYKIGEFHHNIESLHIVDNISRKGEGLNLTFQVRDGIISHDGEVHNTQIIPDKDKTNKEIDRYIMIKKGFYNDKKISDEEKNIISNMMPATLEGCVVRITDTIAYIGQDIEDAIRFNLLKRSELPVDCVEHLGDTNSKIIDSLVKSVVINSYDNNYVCFDEETSFYLKKLKDFNYERIYTDKDVKKTNPKVEKCMEILFEKYINDIKHNNINSKIFKHFLSHKTDKYLQTFKDAEKVRDFIATMTDRYFNEEVKDFLLPWK
jgi:dGTPase